MNEPPHPDSAASPLPAPEPRSEPCPRCHQPNRLTASEAQRPGFECDHCYAEVAASMWEGMIWP